MLINELCIGDWIRYRIEGIGYFARIKEIYEGGVFTQAGEYEGQHLLLDDVEPIRITDAILRKNDFQVNPYAHGFDLYSLEVTTTIAGYDFYQDAKLSGIDGHFTFESNRVKALVSYVHELQHALRDSRIDKDVELYSTPDDTIAKELNAALSHVNVWLKAYGYTVSLDVSSKPENDEVIGEYEVGSVFEKDILVRVYPKRLQMVADEDDMTENELLSQCRYTLYHEVGHALMEQLIDWDENLPELKEKLDRWFWTEFYDVFNDDNMTEEKIVEDFAIAFNDDSDSLLQRCWQKVNAVIEIL